MNLKLKMIGYVYYLELKENNRKTGEKYTQEDVNKSQNNKLSRIQYRAQKKRIIRFKIDPIR